MNYVVGEVLLYDANGNILAVTSSGEAKVEAIQRANTQFDNIIVDPVDPSIKTQVSNDNRLHTNDRKFTLRTFKSDVNIDLPDDNWVEIINVNGKGMPVYLWIEFYNGNYEINISMDGVSSFQMDNLEVVAYNLGVRNVVGYRGYAPYRNATDLFSWHFPDVYYKTDFKLKARRRSGNNRGIDKILFIYKEEIV